MDCSRVVLNSSPLADLSRLNGSLRSDEVSMLRGTRKAPAACRSRLVVHAKQKSPEEWKYPWPKKVTKGMDKEALKLLCRYKPLPVKPKFFTLDFEKPVTDFEVRIEELRDMAARTGMNLGTQMEELEQKYQELRVNLYKNLKPTERLSLARHPNRPTFYDHVLNMTDKWVELHGDRAGHDDHAIVSGIGMMEGMGFMFIGHQKGRNTKENLYRNFGMPQPWGYRKALRMMQHAEHNGFPILTFVDTPGAFAGLEAEECGQGEAIARNLRDMFGFKVPIISTVIGEGGSGGALAIGCGNKMLMMENSVYYVASPEACAAILWKSQGEAGKATEALRITPTDLVELNVVDEVIPEPLGGAQYDPETASKNIKAVILKHMDELLRMDEKAVKKQRLEKFRRIGQFEEHALIEDNDRRNMKPREKSVEELLLPPGATNGLAKVHLDGVPAFVSEKASY